MWRLLALASLLHRASSDEAPARRQGSPTLLQLDSLLREKRSEVYSLLGAQEASDERLRIGSAKLSRQLERLKRVLRTSLAQPDEHGLSRLHGAVIERDAARVKYLLEAGADREATAGDLAVRPIHLSVLSGDGATDCLEELLNAGADPDATDQRGTTPLLAAAALNMPHCTDRLLHHGASPDKPGADGMRALHMASSTNAAEAARVLLQNGATPETTDQGGRSALHMAAAHDSCEVLEEVLDAGGDPDRADAQGKRPMHYAVSACGCSDPKCPRTRALAYLIEVGASVHAEDHEGWRPLHLASERNRLSAVNLLLSAGALARLLAHVSHVASHSRGASPPNNSMTRFLPLSPTPPDAPVLSSGRAGADPNTCGPNGTPPLTVAAYGGADAVVARLPEMGADHDAPDEYGGTPLHAAASGGSKRALKLLLGVGASANQIDVTGRNAVHYAARGGSAKCIRALRKADANLELPNEFGWTPLHVASNFSQASAIEVRPHAALQPLPSTHPAPLCHPPLARLHAA